MTNKKMMTRIMAIVCSITIGVTGIPITSLPAQAANPAEEGNVMIDNGGFKTELFGVGTDTWGQNWSSRSETLPPATTYLTDNYRETVGTVPTSDWASSVVFDQYSESLYAHPLAYRAASNGMQMASPAVVDSTSFVDGEPTVESLLNDASVELVVGADGFTAKDARVDKTTDWTYDILLENNAGTGSIMATLAKGTPYAYYKFNNLTPTISLGAGGTNLAIYKNGTASNVLGVSLTNIKDNKTHYYGLYAPAGTTWTNAGGKLTANMPAGSKYLSVAILPDGTDEAFELYEKYAFNFITDTRVEWEYDENASLITTTYNVITTNMVTGEEGGDTIIAMYPHQWRYSETPLTGYTYKTIRGTMKTTVGTSYTTVMQYNGILTTLPVTTDAEAVGNIKDQLGYLWDYRKNKEDPKWICFLEGQYGGYDTYWVGKNLNTMSEAIFLAGQFDDADMTAMKDDMVEGVANYLQFWFNPYEVYQSGNFVDDYFYYYEDYGTLIGYPASYSSDKEVNDHHFHYGYWIKAAAAVAKNDPTWAENWGGMVYEMISDIANTNRDGSSYNANSPAKYPFLRNFDVYEGHSWASGVANYEYDTDGNLIDPNGGLAGGNNQESSSEAVNAWASLILWGEVVNDTRIRDLGVYLYTTEIAAVEDYYYDVHNEIFTDAYEDRDNYNIQTVTRLFGGRYDHTAWWTENSIEVTTITMLPLSASTLYMGKYKDKVKAVADSINESSAQWTHFIATKDQSCINFGKSDMLTDPETNQDILAMYYAYYDADAAFEMWNKTDQGIVENGESRAHTWAYITSLKEYGTQNFDITGSSALSLVLEKDGVKTYIAENVTDTDERVYFSDGTYIDVPAHSHYSGPKTGDGENPNLRTKVSYTLETYMQNMDRTGYDCVVTTEKANEGYFTLVPASIEGFSFDSTNTNNVLSGTLVSGEDNAVTLRVYYNRLSYQINYVLLDGNNNANNPSEYVYGSSITLNDPVKAGYKFLGWYTDAAYSNKITGITNNTTGNLTLYAKWISETEANYTVNVYKQNVDRNGYEKVESLNKVGEIGQVCSYEYTGDTTGFTKNAEKTVESGTVVSDDSLVLEIYFDRNTYSISYGNMDGANNAYGNATYYVYGAGLALIAPTKDGYTFGGWYTDASCTEGNEISEISTTATGEIVVYAKWTETPVGPGTGNEGEDNISNENITISYDAATKHVTISVYQPGLTGTTIAYIAKYSGTTAEADAKSASQAATDSLPRINLPEHKGIILEGNTNGASGEISGIEINPGDWVVFGVNVGDRGVTSSTGFFYYKAEEEQKTSYKVNHYQQNVSLNGYTLASSDTVSNVEIGSTVNAQAKSYDGFTYNSEISAASGTANADGGLILNLYYDRNTYGITYNNVEGATNPNPGSFVYGVGVQLQDAVKEEYTFLGWYSDEALSDSNKVTAIGATQMSAVTLYAKWKAKQTGETGGGETGGGETGGGETGGGETGGGETGGGETGGGSGEGGENPPVIEKVNYTVQYYVQNTALNGYDELMSEKLTGTADEGTVVNAIIKNYTGFTHNSQVTGSLLSGTATEGLGLKVYYDRNKYNITYHNVEGASNPNASTYTYGVSLSLQDATKENYTFKGWYLDSACSESQKITVISKDSIENKDVYAKWEAKQTGGENPGDGDDDNHDWVVDEVLDQVYTGKKITPTVTVRDQLTNNKLKLNKDYTLKYSNNLNAGIAKIEIKGKGNYSGSRYIKFNILPINLEDNAGVYVPNVYKFTDSKGKPVKIEPSVKLNGKKLKYNKDFKVDISVAGSQTAYIEAGEYNLVLVGMGNYAGTLTTKVVMADKASTILISNAKVTGLKKKLTYDEAKNEYVQNLSLTYKSKPLVEGIHYELEYHNNTEAGTAEVIIKGLMNDPDMKFTGSKSLTYNIEGKKIKENNIRISKSTYEYTGSAIEPVVTLVDAAGNPVSQDNYTVKYSDNLNKGKATITVTGKNAYQGSAKKTFKITGLPLNSENITVESDEQVSFVKGGATANVVVTYNGEVLSPNVDYTLKYSNNKKVGVAKVTVSGTGNFTESVKKTFIINPKSLEETTVFATDAVYKNSAKMKDYLVKPVVYDVDGKKLGEGKDYLKSYKYEIIDEQGNATVVDANSSKELISVGTRIRVTVTAMGDNYLESNSAEYRVIAGTSSIKDAKITIAPQMYTGKPVTISKSDIIKVEVKKNGSYVTLSDDCYEIVEGSFIDNVKKGTAKVTIRGVGEYGGSKQASFKIQSKSIADTYFYSKVLNSLLK